MMNCAKRVGVYAFIIELFVCSQGFATNVAGAKEGAATNNNGARTTAVAKSTEFQWSEHGRLTWEDFRGPVKPLDDETAAATHCGIGFRTNSNAEGKPEIEVYNAFYVNKSWVRPDAHMQSILDHEQGHFDLCEIYTRKLRNEMSRFDFSVADVRGSLMSIYERVSDEYEARQQAYESQTAHGTISSEQKRWQNTISNELNPGIGMK